MRTSEPGQSALLLLDVIDALSKRKIPYAIIGAFAASFYGAVRASLDADAVISLHAPREAKTLCEDFVSLGFHVELHHGDMDDPITAVLHVRDAFLNRVDLLIGIRGMPKEVFERVQETRFMGSSIKIMGLEDFIAGKIFAGSAKDIQDVVNVLNISSQKIDLVLAKELASLYGQACLKRLQSLLRKQPNK